MINEMLAIFWERYPILQEYHELNPEINTFYDSSGRRHIGDRVFFRAQSVIYRNDKMRELT